MYKSYLPGNFDQLATQLNKNNASMNKNPLAKKLTNVMKSVKFYE